MPSFDIYNLKVNDTGKGVDVAAIKAALGDLFLGSEPYGDDSQTTLVQVPRKSAQIRAAWQIVHDLGYQTEDDAYYLP